MLLTNKAPLVLHNSVCRFLVWLINSEDSAFEMLGYFDCCVFDGFHFQNINTCINGNSKIFLVNDAQGSVLYF